MSNEPTPRGGRTRWQEYVISKAYFLEHECNRLCDRGCESAETTRYVKAATSRHLKAARQAAGVTKEGNTDLQVARRHRLVNAWSGAAVEGAFVNLHAAEVVLANLYSEQDISSRVPDVLARMRTCLPADDERRIKAEALFGAQINGAASAATTRQRRRNGNGNGRQAGQGMSGQNGAGPNTLTERRPDSATPCVSPTTPPMSSTPGCGASATC